MSLSEHVWNKKMVDALRTIQEGVRSEERTVAERQKLSRMAANEMKFVHRIFWKYS